eukprot:243273-Pelagomonas_calceolata.AAC.11
MERKEGEKAEVRQSTTATPQSVRGLAAFNCETQWHPLPLVMQSVCAHTADTSQAEKLAVDHGLNPELLKLLAGSMDDEDSLEMALASPYKQVKVLWGWYDDASNEREVGYYAGKDLKAMASLNLLHLSGGVYTVVPMIKDYIK